MRSVSPGFLDYLSEFSITVNDVTSVEVSVKQFSNGTYIIVEANFNQNDAEQSPSFSFHPIAAGFMGEGFHHATTLAAELLGGPQQQALVWNIITKLQVGNSVTLTR